MVTSINYNETDQNSYKYVKTGDKIFDSGDFVRDWYYSMKYIIHLEDSEWEPQSHSSSVNHFIMDGDKYDSAYLAETEDGSFDLVYDYNGKGIEFFVPAGEKWTWKELRKYCGDEKKV